MENRYPKIRYRESAQGIVITACYGEESSVFLPDEIEGVSVTAIAPYAFAGGEIADTDKFWNPYASEEELRGGHGEAGGDTEFEKSESEKSEPRNPESENSRIQFEKLIELRLPREVREVGRYAFYRCRNLKKLIFSDAIAEIGGGALNGCRISEVEIHLYHGERCALKSVLDEMRFEIRACLHYESGEGKFKTARLLFPEHYEEAVENTPARILYTSHHGAGGYYRQCFYDRKPDYRKYDETFFRALAEEDKETITELAMGRLICPYELTDEARGRYEGYLKEHIVESAELFAKTEDREALDFLRERRLWTKEAFDGAINCAARLGKTELLGRLMDEKHQIFPKRGKTFEL